MAAPIASLTGDVVAIAAKGSVNANDVLTLRRKIFADGIVTRVDLALLFVLAEQAPDGDLEWRDFFAEAVADFYLREEEPQGYLTQDEFADLKTWVTRDGAKTSTLELGLLVKLLEAANRTPSEMIDFIRDQIKLAISQKDGGPIISKDDVELIRRFLFAVGGDGNIAVTRMEAELLFDLNDMTAGVENHPAWSDLFIKAVANHLMAYIGYRPPNRREALERQAWLEDANVNIGGFFRKMYSGGLDAIRTAYARDDEFTKRNAKFEASAAAAEKITGQEADWLADRIKADGDLCASERALIEYMRTLGAELPPKLKALIKRAA